MAKIVDHKYSINDAFRECFLLSLITNVNMFGPIKKSINFLMISMMKWTAPQRSIL